MMITDDELEEFKKSNTFKMLVKGSYLGVMEKEFSKMTKKQLVDECFKKEVQIFDLTDKLELTEKALELACLELRHFKCFCSDHQCIHYGEKECWAENYSEENCSKVMGNDFKTKVKEMMKSE